MASRQNSTSPRPAWTIVSWPGAATASQNGVTSPMAIGVDHGQLAVGGDLDQAQHGPVGVFRDELRVEGDGLRVGELSAILPQLFVGGDVVVLHGFVECATQASCYAENRNVTNTNNGIRMPPLYNRYPKKLGMATPDFSAMALTMKFGPLPM